MAHADLRAPASDAESLMLLARQHSVSVRGIDMSYAQWGEDHAPTVLLVHATGFHGRCWDAVVRELAADGGPPLRVLAPDLRGHGRSTKRGPYDWREFGADVAAFVEALGLQELVAGGHSMGGHSVVQAAGQLPMRFHRLLLVDPVIMEPGSYDERSPRFAGTASEHPVARRRNAWASADEMVERFRDRHPFRLWRADVLRDYCQHGLIRQDDGYVLACPPLVEASIYLGSAGRDISHVLAGLPHPTVVLRAYRKSARDGEMDFAQSPTWPGLADALPSGRDVHLPALTHFIPMQRPDLVAAHVRELLDPARAVRSSTPDSIDE